MKDNEIIAMYFERNNTAIEKTDEQYGAYLRKIAMNILGNHEDGEECLNDTYLRLWNTIPPQKPASLMAYAGRIIRNLAFDKYRSANTQKRGNGEMPLILDELGAIVSGGDTPEKEVDRKELAKSIDDFLHSLDEYKRAYFICRYWRAMSFGEIAKKYSKTDNYIAVSLKRTRDKMKKYLEERGYEI